jgi:hypothetical protein
MTAKVRLNTIRNGDYAIHVVQGCGAATAALAPPNSVPKMPRPGESWASSDGAPNAPSLP